MVADDKRNSIENDKNSAKISLLKNGDKTQNAPFEQHFLPFFFNALFSPAVTSPSLRTPFKCPFPLVPGNSGVDVFCCLYLGADIRG